MIVYNYIFTLSFPFLLLKISLKAVYYLLKQLLLDSAIFYIIFIFIA